MKSNFILKIIILISAVLVVVIFFQYRTATFPKGMELLECLMSLFVLAGFATFLWKNKLGWLDSKQGRSVEFGLYFGLLWTIEIGINNFIRPGLPLRDHIDNSFWAAIAVLILFTAIYQAYRVRKISAGINAGFWSGLASGAVACLTALVLIVFGMNLILLDPLNAREWSDVKAANGLQSMAVYFAYQTLAGAMMHLVILGAMMGLILGLIGGLAGRMISMLKKNNS